VHWVTRVRVYGLGRFGLGETFLRRLGDRKVLADVHLRTFDVTTAVQRLRPAKRFGYISVRVAQWIRRIYRRYPKISFRAKAGYSPDRRVRRWSQLPSRLMVRATAREVVSLAKATGVSAVYVTGVAGRRRRRSPKSSLGWYCVRAFVVIRIERAKSGLQSTEDRFILVRAASIEDAKRRLTRQWREYASAYLNPNGQIVSWSVEKVVDVYDTGATEIDPDGTEIYSKLGHRRMRPEYVWRPKSR
jgi:hypothetical protein